MTWTGEEQRRGATHGGRGELRDVDERVMVTIPRGQGEEVRVTFTTAKTADGGAVAWHGIRVWFRGTDGAMHPGKAGISIRARELPLVAVALLRACASRVPAHLHGAVRELVASLSGGPPA